MKEKFYDLKNILATNADYNIIFGERSNGKTYAVLKYLLERYAKKNIQGAIIRRWRDDFQGKRGASTFDALVANNEIKKLTNGVWSDVYYFSGRWYLCTYNEKGERTTDEKPFCYGFAITSMEHDKGTSFPGVGTILFDEFITRTGYLPDEFVLFNNVLSTIIRHRDTVNGEPIKIFMCGNSVNKYSCPYYSEMGLKHVKEMEQGAIDVYEYGESGLRVAVEYVKPTKNGKKSDKFFAFDNPRLNMVTSGGWEIDVYPHCPCKIKPKDILYTYYIIYDGEPLVCNVVRTENLYFTFIHQKHAELEERDTDLIYSTAFDARPNFRRKITKPRSDLERKLAEFFIKDKVFYENNETGEIVRNYLMWCGKEGV